jgi:hypothetical protein
MLKMFYNAGSCGLYFKTFYDHKNSVLLEAMIFTTEKGFYGRNIQVS